MSKKYIATIDLYFDKQKYTIVGETDTKKLELIELVKQFASKGRMECRVKEKKLFKEGVEVGSFSISSISF